MSHTAILPVSSQVPERAKTKWLQKKILQVGKLEIETQSTRRHIKVGGDSFKCDSSDLLGLNRK